MTPAPAAPRALPWSLAIRIAAGLLAPALLALAFAPATILAAVGGSFLAIFGSFQGSTRRSLMGGAAVLLLFLVSQAAPGALDIRAVILCLALAAGIETVTQGGRSLTLSIFAAVMLIGAIRRYGAPPDLAALVFVASLAFGALLAEALNLSGKAALPPNDIRSGVEHALFLAIGLLLSLALVQRMEGAQALWIVQMFVLRAMAPPKLDPARTAQFVAGAVIGAGLAAGLETLGLETRAGLRLCLAALCLVVGLRFLPVGRTLSAAALTLAVLLATAPTPEAALFRAEAAGVSAALALGLLLILQHLAEWAWPRRDPSVPWWRPRRR